MSHSYDSMRESYAADLAKDNIRPINHTEVVRQARHLIGIMDRYQAVSKLTGVPAAWLAVVDYRESDNDPRTYLGNGDRIIGTQERTHNVPRNRGPFKTWEEGAIDALRYMGLSNQGVVWNMAYAAWQAERWNGFGCTDRGCVDPYLWGGTALYVQGGFPTDGKFDANYINKQIGVMPLLQMIGTIEEGFSLS